MISPEILDEIKTEALKEFEMLSRVYRPSFHTRKICDYLKQRVQEIRPGVEVYEDQYRGNLVNDEVDPNDSSGNLWFNVPANDPAFEKAQPIIVQAHMDMVCSFMTHEAKEDMIKNGIALEYHMNGTLTSRGNLTTLGADNGIGIAFILAIIKSNTFKHGPIRGIFTTDEEVGMLGASFLGLTRNGEKGAPVKGCNYIINIDTVSDGEIAISAPGAVVTQFTIPVDPDAKPIQQGLNTYTLYADEFKGGHDGIEIDKHSSAIRAVGDVLKQINKTEDFRLIEYLSPGCEFQNVIQKYSYATFTSSMSFADVERIVENYENDFKRMYPEETEAKIFLKLAELPQNADIRPYSHETSTKIVDLITSLPHGVVEWKDKSAGWIGASGNMGPIFLTMKKEKQGEREVWSNPSFVMKAHFRSCDNTKLEESIENNKKLAKDILGDDGLDYFQMIMLMYGWAGDDSKSFLNTAMRAFEERGVKWKLSNLRYGLEVSWFKYYNPDLNMISVGPETHNIHECTETLYTGTLQNVIGVILTCIESMRIIGK